MTVEEMRQLAENDGIDPSEITPEMIAAGEDAILYEIGGDDLGGYFSAEELAEKVYLAMAIARSAQSRHMQRQAL